MKARQHGSAVDVLVVDDDPEAYILLAEVLGQDYHLALASAPGQALDLMRIHRFPLALVDVRLPEMSGLDLVPRLRAMDPQMGVILITAYSEVKDAVRALRDLQAMDYIEKPISPEDLRQRVTRALDSLDDRRRVSLGDLSLDRQSRQVAQGTHLLSLTRRDFDLLLYLAYHKGRTVSYEELVRQVWDREPLPLHERKVRSAVSRLRRKLKAGAGDRAYIRTVWGLGYEAHD